MIAYTNKIDEKRFLEPIMELQKTSRKGSVPFDSINRDRVMQYQKKIAKLNKKISMEPNNWEYIEERGDFYLESGQYLKGVLDYLAAHKLCTDDDIDVNIARCFFARGLILENADSFDDAWKDYDMAVGFDILNPLYNFRFNYLESKLNKNNETWNQ